MENRVTRLMFKRICSVESPVNIGDRCLGSHLKTQVHCHDFHELFIVREGVVRHHVNGVVDDLPAGTICLISPADTHFFERHPSCETARFTNVAFDSKVYADVRRFLSVAPAGEPPLLPPVLRTPGRDSLARLDERIMLMRPGSRLDFAGKSVQLRLLIGDVFALFAVAGKEHSCDADRGVPAWLVSAMSDMQERDNYVAGLERLVQLCGRSQEYVNRSIRRWYSSTPTQMVNQLRLGEAARLLTDTDMAVSRALLACGFNNPSYFVALFRERFGCSPREFRHRNRIVTDPVDVRHMQVAG